MIIRRLCLISRLTQTEPTSRIIACNKSDYLTILYNIKPKELPRAERLLQRLYIMYNVTLFDCIPMFTAVGAQGQRNRGF